MAGSHQQDLGSDRKELGTLMASNPLPCDSRWAGPAWGPVSFQEAVAELQESLRKSGFTVPPSSAQRVWGSQILTFGVLWGSFSLAFRCKMGALRPRAGKNLT